MDIYEIRELFLGDRFNLTDHAHDELANENLSVDDISAAIGSGEIINKDVDPERGTELLIEGMNWAKESICVKIAVADDGDLIVITVYRRRQKRRGGRP